MAELVYKQALSIVQQRLLDRRQIEAEYRNVIMRDQVIDHTVEQSQRPENSTRNRYINVLPYDHNRVELSTHPGYVNASHVSYSDGLTCNYIATQGPLPGTVEEFWRMCLEKGCTAIVMLTNLVERGMTKCAQYYPDKVGEVLSTPTLKICTVDVMTTAHNELTIRKIQVKDRRAADGGMQPETTITHYHYHAWPDHGTPEESLAIRSMCDALLEDRLGGQNVVVHCSAGIGRTGTFIVIDIVRLRLQRLCKVAEQGGDVPAAAVHQALEIPELVHLLRQQRMGMVQTSEQYVFIYHALKEELAELVAKKQAP